MSVQTKCYKNDLEWSVQREITILLSHNIEICHILKNRCAIDFVQIAHGRITNSEHKHTYRHYYLNKTHRLYMNITK